MDGLIKFPTAYMDDETAVNIVKHSLTYLEGDGLTYDAMTYAIERVAMTDLTQWNLSNRKTILDAAEKCVCHDRQNTHGRPEDSFGAIADLWTAYLDAGREITPVDVAQMMILLKVGRAKENPKHQDNWVDMAGYAACAGEIAAEIYGE